MPVPVLQNVVAYQLIRFVRLVEDVGGHVDSIAALALLAACGSGRVVLAPVMKA